ncbi:phosphate starvation-inducible protein PsiF [Lichenihabitans psoromatis]|uniref:phosphate starvation-inducible protein PsiF n=1 Tax=Lichenihabitans psoromatis TaxID=2528642 RepID=UPI0010383917|nr:phosphate starvation-inducible protein PsiF [Lichenihabitans psoromatis]
MKIVHLLAAASLACLLVSGPALAQTAAPAAAAPAATTAPAMAAPAAGMMDKKAKSKDCSLQADKQGLHGKARHAFRSKCKSGKM